MPDYGEYAAIAYEFTGPELTSNEQTAERRRDEEQLRVNYAAGNAPSVESTLLQQNRARRVVPEILYDGQNVGLSEKLTSLSYTDNDQGRVDEVSLVFEDASALWMMREWIPERGHDIDVSMWFMDWSKPGDNQKYHCGNFTIDDLTYTGPPWTCTIKGVAILAESDMQTELKSKTWENVTLKQIVLEKMDVYGGRAS